MARKKMYYLPGLISLVGLPFIFLFFIPPDKPEPVKLQFYMPNDRTHEEGYISFSKYSVWIDAKKKKQVTVQFWYKDTTELMKYRKAEKFDFIGEQIRKLAFSHDTNTVLKIELGEGILYKDFVYILNLMLIYDVKRYALTDNTFYIFGNVLLHEEEIPIQYCGVGEFMKKAKEEKISLSNLSNRKLLLLAGFIALVIIPGLFRVKKYYFKGMSTVADNADI